MSTNIFSGVTIGEGLKLQLAEEVEWSHLHSRFNNSGVHYLYLQAKLFVMDDHYMLLLYTYKSLFSHSYNALDCGNWNVYSRMYLHLARKDRR